MLSKTIANSTFRVWMNRFCPQEITNFMISPYCCKKLWMSWQQAYFQYDIATNFTVFINHEKLIYAVSHSNRPCTNAFDMPK